MMVIGTDENSDNGGSDDDDSDDDRDDDSDLDHPQQERAVCTMLRVPWLT